MRRAAVFFGLALLAAPAGAQQTVPAGPPAVPIVASLTGNPFFSPEAPLPPARPLYLTFGATAAPELILSEADRLLINAISAHHSGIDTMVGKFLQIDEQGGRLEGVFYLDRPDKVRFRYAPPSFDEIISTGRGFYVVDRKARTRSVYPQDQVPLRQFLTDHIDLLSANLTDVVRTDEMIALSLADDTPIGQVKVTLVFEIATNDLRQWSLTEPNGGQLTFSIYETITGIAIPARYFSIDPTLIDTNPNN